MFSKLKILLIAVFLFPLLLSGQIKRADKFYEKSEYMEALYQYQKAWAKNSDDDYIVEQIGKCYRNLGHYVLASEYFERTFQINPQNENAKLEFANALIRSMKIKQAEVFLIDYLTLNPENEKAAGLLKTVNHIIQMQEEKYEIYTISKLENINSEYDDFGPVLFKDSILVFTSNRAEDLKDFSGVKSNEERITNMYFTEFDRNQENSLSKPEILFKSLYERNNQGPVTFTHNEGLKSKAYFNSTGTVAQNKGEKLSMKVFTLEYSGDSWGKPKSINLNNDDFSIHHPFISPDGKLLFFASDMPGGQGGLDIYYATKTDGLWNKPINLGPFINTEANEAFPTFNDSTLYFSSNGHIGYGKYDIYEVDDYESPSEINNLGHPLNSSSDDFSIYFYSSDQGFFASNRSASIGGDDIFTFKRQLIDTNTTYVRGKIEFNSFPIGKTRVDLVDNENNILQTIITNEEGEFIFSGLGIHTLYSFNINHGNIPDTLDTRFYMLNSNGEKVLVLLQSVSGEYDFESLPPEEYDALPRMNENLSLLTIEFKGHIYHNTKGDINKQVTLYVLNDDNKVIAKGYTDKEGNFSFSKLPPQDHYKLYVADDIEGVNIVVLKEGDQIIELAANSNNEFIYVRLDPDEDYITLINESGEPVRIKMGENFKVDNIYYAYDSWEINAAAASSLDRLLSLMKINPHISIILYSHTDSRGGDDYNLELSQKRAESAKEYLAGNEIESIRIKAIGMGETKLVNRCEDGIECSEMEHAKNRRTEFVIERNQH